MSSHRKVLKICEATRLSRARQSSARDSSIEGDLLLLAWNVRPSERAARCARLRNVMVAREQMVLLADQPAPECDPHRRRHEHVLRGASPTGGEAEEIAERERLAHDASRRRITPPAMHMVQIDDGPVGLQKLLLLLLLAAP